MMNERVKSQENTGFESARPLTRLLENSTSGMEFHFDRVKLPVGCGANFVLPVRSDGEPNEIGEIKGVILYSHPVNIYYNKPFDGEENAPDCSSADGIRGYGYPGTDCRSCPYNRFGSGHGRSKLCKNRRMLYILQEGKLFPVMLSLPTASLRLFSDYVMEQLRNGKLVSEIVTVIQLHKAINRDGNTYPEVAFQYVRDLKTEEKDIISDAIEVAQKYASTLMPAQVMIDPMTGEMIRQGESL